MHFDQGLQCLQILKVRPDIGAIVVKGAVPGKPGNVLEITPAKIVGKNIGPQIAKKAAAEQEKQS